VHHLGKQACMVCKRGATHCQCLVVVLKTLCDG
jgi:hypothetical protein